MTAWDGDWEARIRARVGERGYETVTAFAEARPTATLLALAGELGADDVVAIQVLTLMREEALGGGDVERFARGLLVHELWESIPKGWRIDPGGGFEFTFKLASAIANLVVALPDSHQDLGRRVGDLLVAADLPAGWLPSGPDDPTLVAIFEAARR